MFDIVAIEQRQGHLQKTLDALKYSDMEMSNYMYAPESILVTTSEIKLPDKFKYLHRVNWDTPLKSVADCSQFVLTDLINILPETKAEHVLLIQWDGFILDVDKWVETFLMYDYIGAPWYFQHPALYKQIGNGGFSLRSKRMMRFIADNIVKFYQNVIDWTYTNAQIKLDFLRAEDNMIGVANRKWLESNGFKFPPLEVADRFACETKPYNGSQFGFHGTYHTTQLPERARKHIERYA